MKRTKMSSKKSRRDFKSKSNKSHKRNSSTGIRGGIRL